ncbi:hypothetical protein Rhein_1462 [Rheinheimera sp. A13L]|nr:hypothetical protein Rhein_1462 [Rheinheimera sp. A13L]
MKYLSLIALFFYFASFCTAVPYSAAENLLALQSTSKGMALAAHLIEPELVKHAAYSADPDHTAVLWHQFGFSSVVGELYSVVPGFFHTTRARCFSARAPPLVLS